MTVQGVTGDYFPSVEMIKSEAGPYCYIKSGEYISGRMENKGNETDRLAFSLLKGESANYVAFRSLRGLITKIGLFFNYFVPLSVLADGEVKQVAVNVNSLAKRLNISCYKIIEKSKKGELESYLSSDRLQEVREDYVKGVCFSLNWGYNKDKETACRIRVVVREFFELSKNDNDIIRPIDPYDYKLISFPQEIRNKNELLEKWNKGVNGIREELVDRIKKSNNNQPAFSGNRMITVFRTTFAKKQNKTDIQSTLKTKLDSLIVRDVIADNVTGETVGDVFRGDINKKTEMFCNELLEQFLLNLNPVDTTALKKEFMETNQLEFIEISKKLAVYSMGCNIVHFALGSGVLHCIKQGDSSIESLTDSLKQRGFTEAEIECLKKMLSSNYKERPTQAEVLKVFSS